MVVDVSVATDADAPAIVALRTSVADDLSRRYGLQPRCPTEAGVLRAIRTSRVLVTRNGARIIATLRLAAKKPWAIDISYFESVQRPLYLADMAVEPSHQQRGVGRRLVDAAISVARAWPADAIRLDAYDAEHGAGGFYERCGFREVGRATYRKTPLIYYELLLHPPG
jgi:GNAT superfamily N-acetyltransferase